MNSQHFRIGSLLLVLLVAPLAWCQGQQITGTINGEEVVGPMPGVKATVLITDQRLDLLRRGGSLQIPVPARIGDVQSVVLKRPIFFKEKVAVGYGNSIMQSQSMLVDITETVLDRIDYQPVELRVYESGFSSIVLKYTGGLSGTKKANEQVGDPKVDSPVVTLKLRNGRGIMGRMKGLKTLAVTSDIGKLDLDVANIRKIQTGKNGKLTIEMPSGNRISGTISETGIELLNRWEDETFEFSKIKEIVIEPPVVINALPQQSTTLPLPR